MNEWLQSLVDKAKGFVWDDEPEQIVRDQQTAVEADSFDEMSWQMLQDTLPNLRKSIESVADDQGEHVPPAYEDLFNLLHQGDPVFKDRDRMADGFDANHQMLSEMARSDEFKGLREETAYDEWGTAFALVSMEPKMREQFERIAEARQRQQEAQQQAQAAQQALQQAIDQAGQPGADPAAAGAAVQTAVQAAQAADQALEQAQEAQEQASEQAGEAMAQAAKEAKDEIDEDNQRAAAYGLQPGQLQRMPWNERRALTKRLDNDKLTKLAKLIGQFRRYGDAERRKKIKHAPSVVVDIEFGRDLENLVDDEIIRMAVPEFEDLFFLDYARQQLMEWEEAGPENAGQGPILVVCDESGSMSADVDGKGNTREMWSKAISMALCDQAKRGKRDFIYLGFSSSGQMWEKHFPGGNAALDDVIDFVTHFFHGGTNYEGPLTRASEIVTEYGRSGRAKPDVVFVTDDDCRVSDSFVRGWQKTKGDLDLTCYGIQIGVTKTSNAMHKLCDKTVLLTRLNSNPEGMQELFRTI